MTTFICCLSSLVVVNLAKTDPGRVHFAIYYCWNIKFSSVRLYYLSFPCHTTVV